MARHLLFAAGAIALFLIVVAVLSSRDDATSASSAVDAAQRAPSGSVGAPERTGTRERKVRPTAPPQAAARRARPVLRDQRPARLVESDLSAAARAELEAMERERPGTKQRLDYLLGLLAHLADCVDDADSLEGRVTLTLHFHITAPEAPTLEGRGTRAELFDAPFAPAVSEAILVCVESFHEGRDFALPRAPPEGNTYYWGTSIDFPLAEDSTYRWFQ